MHYGYADEENKSFEKSLFRMNTFLIEQANITKDDYILDAGCGVGGSSIFMSKHTGCRATGITLAPRQVESATKSAKSLTLMIK